MSLKISDAELMVMRILWREGRPLSYKEIRTELEEKTNWNKSTIQTLVVRLREKGVINAATHYVTLYSANISEQAYLQSEGQTFLDKLFDGSAAKIVTTLYKEGRISEADIQELKEFFRMEDEEK